MAERKIELNKKLAEWALKNNPRLWIAYARKEMPDFTQSLDACFEWLVPKLNKTGYLYELLQWNNGQHKAIINKKCEGWAQTECDAIADTPALALCLAFEKLIDGENNG